MCCVEVALKGFASTGKGLLYTGFPRSLTDGYAMPMSPSKGKTAVHGCHCLRDMAVSMREVMARSWVGVCVPQQEGRRAFRVRIRHRGPPCADLALKCALFTLFSQLAFEFLSGNMGNFNCFSLERFFDIRTYLLWL